MTRQEASSVHKGAPYLSCERDQAEGLSASEDQNNGQDAEDGQHRRQNILQDL